jgi:hypothetical protein
VLKEERGSEVAVWQTSLGMQSGLEEENARLRDDLLRKVRVSAGRKA